MKRLIGSALILAFILIARAEDSGRPRQLNKDGATAIVHQPPVDSWNNFTDLDAGFAVSLKGANHD